jgi:putative ABC transport system substrate-binding protein
VPVALHQKRIAEIAAGHRLATIFPGGTAAGGLLAYGTSIADTWPLMPIMADKIIKGAKPGDLPVEVTTRRELIAFFQSRQVDSAMGR